MTLRGRVALVVALAVAGAVILVGVGVQALVVRTLYAEVDRDLRGVAAQLERGPRGALQLLGPRRDRFGGAAGLVRVVDAAGRTVGVPGLESDVALPVTRRVRAVAAGTAPAFLRTADVEGRPLQILTAPLAEGLAVQVARPLDEVVRVIAALRRGVALVALVAAALAALVARRLASRSVRPVTELTARVDAIRGTDDLGTRLGVHGDDEVGRLAAAFDGMLGRLEAARDAQERLTADASHELRTPLTSLRTNLEVLTLAEDRRAALDAAERARLLADVRGQVAELTAMVDGLVAIARDGGPGGAREPVDLAVLAEEVLAAARRRHPQRAGDLRLEVGAPAGGAVVAGERDRLRSAVTNLVDNAVKYSDDGSIVVAVAAEAGGGTPVRGGAAGEVRLSVRDHGPGVAPSDLPHLFERFYRAATARSAPGAGLGLALVAQVARDHGGRVEARLPEDGGLEVELVLPAA